MNSTSSRVKRQQFVRRHVFEAGSGLKIHAGSSAFVEQGVEDIARSVGVREELALRLFVKRDPERGEPSDDITRRKRFEDLSDGSWAATIEVALGDRGIRDVAARPAADENLRARTRG
jgi:hypothetical protein